MSQQQRAPPPDPFAQAIVVFFDTEASGVDPSNVDIWQIAAEVDPACQQRYFSQTKIPLAFDSFVQPVDPNICGQASKVNGITWDDLKGAPPVRDVLTQFVTWLTSLKAECPECIHWVVLTAHNCEKYDKVLLMREAKDANVMLPKWLVFGDTLPVFVSYAPHKSNSLTGLAERYLQNADDEEEHTTQKSAIQIHRADSDVRLLMSVVYQCFDTDLVFQELLRPYMI